MSHHPSAFGWVSSRYFSGLVQVCGYSCFSRFTLCCSPQNALFGTPLNPVDQNHDALKGYGPKIICKRIESLMWCNTPAALFTEENGLFLILNATLHYSSTMCIRAHRHGFVAAESVVPPPFHRPTTSRCAE